MDKAWQKKLFSWYETPLGQSFLHHEKQLQRTIIDSSFAMTVLRCGEAPGCSVDVPLIEPDSIVQQIDLFSGEFVGLLDNSNAEVIFAEMMQIPIETATIDVVLVQHCLEFSKTPHDLLREFHRVLAPEGTLILTTFNPLSLWGLTKLVGQHFNKAPWLGCFYTFNRIQDWLLLLGFDEIQCHSFCYQPPIPHQGFFKATQFLNRMEQMSWVNLGAGMVITAKKRVVSGLPVTMKPVAANAMTEVCFTREK